MGNTTFLLALFFLPALGWPAARILASELVNRLISSGNACSAEKHSSLSGSFGGAGGAAFAILIHAAFGMMLVGGPTFANVNDHWQYVGDAAELEPLAYGVLLFTGAAGGVFAALTLLAYDRFRTRVS